MESEEKKIQTNSHILSHRLPVTENADGQGLSRLEQFLLHLPAPLWMANAITVEDFAEMMNGFGGEGVSRKARLQLITDFKMRFETCFSIEWHSFADCRAVKYKPEVKQQFTWFNTETGRFLRFSKAFGAHFSQSRFYKRFCYRCLEMRQSVYCSVCEVYLCHRNNCWEHWHTAEIVDHEKGLGECTEE